ncbi:OmpH family outer membrane protein [Salibacter halophilus]|uniref:OmpH family outer membrane protein n=1 Tax=Salibacter halophilus TaxID=1803916 RepID=A0A6N6M764_9FLAO|nr:OmpH family outer membrane protein [Salibacter halophilus]KAB1065898.1 OmpH family outer membrane protein [Salibacter halophilus]
MKISYLLLLAILSIGCGKNSTENRIAYINTSTLISEYKGTEDMLNELDRIKSKSQTQVDSFKNVLSVEYQNIRQTSQNDEASQFRVQNFKKMQNQFKEFREQELKKVSEKEQKLSAGILNLINSKVRKYGDEHDFDLIIGATENGSVMYGNDKMNITSDVLQYINQD